MKSKMPKPWLLALLAIAVAVAAFALMSKSDGGSQKKGTDNTVPVKPSTTNTPRAIKAKPENSQKPSTNEANIISLPADVSNSLKSGRAVLVLFWSPGVDEDRLVKKELDQARTGISGKIDIYQDSSKNIAKYSLIASNVSQSPAIVVITPELKEKVAQGFIDSGSIEEMVNDMLKSSKRK